MARKMVYQWREEAHVDGLDPQQVGEHLESIKKRHQGLLTPEAVLADAKFKRSPLHSYFEWDDSAAAGKYRAEQARYLIRHLVVVIDEHRDSPAPVRAFVHVDIEDGKRSGYMDIRSALTNEELRGQILRRALSELHAWRTRYTELRELSEVFDAIETADQEFALK